ncbi:MAG: hypothetical protein L6R40_003312 [Gallowayella cf. fulva]|nr:MAG: hypothetical protein L6R40_003312 [Xanthomendoza cf. fulva]
MVDESMDLLVCWHDVDRDFTRFFQPVGSVMAVDAFVYATLAQVKLAPVAGVAVEK